jgi:hypothetical protein
MLVTLSPIVTLVRLVQPSNAPPPMRVTLLGIVTLVGLVRYKNAPFPMRVTGRPLVALGMATAPPRPVYRVMVIALLLVVYSNWACPAAGHIKTSSNSRSQKPQIGWEYRWMRRALREVIVTMNLGMHIRQVFIGISSWPSKRRIPAPQPPVGFIPSIVQAPA